MSIEVASFFVAAVALIVSVFTLWYTAIRRGIAKMTKPNQVGLGFSEPGTKNQVFVRSLIFSTSKRGVVIENMYARVRSGERAQNFSVWVHGEPNAMRRGGGLTVSENGVSANFHFLLRKDEPDFELAPGKYQIEIFAKLLNRSDAALLSSVELEVTSDLLRSAGSESGLQFDWAPDTRVYVGHVSKKSTPLMNKDEMINTIVYGNPEGKWDTGKRK